MKSEEAVFIAHHIIPPFRACSCLFRFYIRKLHSGGLGGSLCHHFPQFYGHSIS